MFDVKTMDEVKNIIQLNFTAIENQVETVDIESALGRILATAIYSSDDIPGFNRSTVDGFAVISSDTFGANDSIPAQLELAFEIKMGEKPTYSLKKGQTASIPTGGELPQNADSVVMLEYSENYNDGFIYLSKSSAPGNNVVFRGDDCKKNEVVIEKGTVIRPQEIGAIAALGVSQIKVYRKLRVAIISTGDEIVDINENVDNGSKIRDINSYTLFAGVLEAGAFPARYGIIKDEYENLFAATKKAYEECDIVIISGGSSVGARDYTYRVIENLSESVKNDSPGVLVHGIAVKPGKPTIIGKVGGKAIIGLPGHPVSAYMVFKTVIVPLIRRMKGDKIYYDIIIDAYMKFNYPSNHGREEYLPVAIVTENGIVYAEPVFGKSGLITNLVSAQGFIHIKRGQEGLLKNELVKVTMF